MIKLIVSPLFYTLVVLFSFEMMLVFNKKKYANIIKSVLGSVIILLWLFSTNLGANLLAQPLEGQYKDCHSETNRIDVVVILSCGFSVDSLGRKKLDDFSFNRVYYGVKAFQRNNARLLIMTGRLPNGDKHLMTQLMGDYAVELGVPKDRIVLEPNARNTYEHPIEVCKLNLIKKNDVIGITTSAWHLSRAMGEFRRYYSKSIPIPADSLVNFEPQGIENFYPSAGALERSTVAINEYVGQVWYVIRHVNSK